MATRSSQYVDGTYSQKVADWHVEDSARKAAFVLRMLTRHRLAPRTVCDIGCGAGEVLAQMQHRMSRETVLTGYDISPQAIALCRPRRNRRLRFVCGDALTMDLGQPELVLLLDVFEHVPDYIGFLEALSRKASWFVFHIPLEVTLQTICHGAATLEEMRSKYGHLHHFTKETALAALRDTGYEVADHFYTDDWHRSPPKRLKNRICYELRRLMFWWKPDCAARIFHGFNLLVLARPRCARPQPRRIAK